MMARKSKKPVSREAKQGLTKPCDAFVSIISNWHGKFYASGVGATGDEFVCIGITGPYATEREAEKWAARWIKAVDKAMKTGKPVCLPDAASVPDDARAYITVNIKATLRERGFDALQGTVFGKRLQ